jgi:hypothetical protein
MQPKRSFEQCCGLGSGIRFFLPLVPEYGTNIPDHISDSLETVFRPKNILMRIRIRDTESL